LTAWLAEALAEVLREAQPARQGVGVSERRITAAMLEVRDRADGFAGLAPDRARPDRILSAFQEAEPYLHLPIHGYKLVTWLVKQTRSEDWKRVGRGRLCGRPGGGNAKYSGSRRGG
jgi:Replication protein C N-terminal domain